MKKAATICCVLVLMLSSHFFLCEGFVTPTNKGVLMKQPMPFYSIHAHPTENVIVYHAGASSSSSLHVVPTGISDISPLLLSSNEVALKSIATGLGYLVGAASVLLYTPIAIRVLRTKSAEGLAISTWWLKLTSYTCTDVYNIKNGFPISAFSEALVITVEASVILALVAFYQRRLDVQTFVLAVTYFTVTFWALFAPTSFGPSNEAIAFAQEFSIVLNVVALLPQLKQNYERQSAGGYSPITASLASVGCTIRLFTTFELANGDPLLLVNYGVALALNLSLLLQIMYYATQKEGKTLTQLYLADVKSDS
jgi:mannose-P-dolichol utilization defect protein 1